MARFQTLPDRIDCVINTVNDQVMCIQYGNVIDCCVIFANTKCQLNVMGTCCLWTTPPGVCSIFVEMWGGGGGGSGNGGCCCCAQGVGGGSGGYFSATIPTKPGCQYTVCGGVGGTYGSGACTQAGSGGSSYISGFNAGTSCAVGGYGSASVCNSVCTCLGNNASSNSYAVATSAVVLNNALLVCGEGGKQFGQAQGCRYENRGGSAPFNGGVGSWIGYISSVPNSNPGRTGQFPGGGGSGAGAPCCCATCMCGGCGGMGLVRIWY